MTSLTCSQKGSEMDTYRFDPSRPPLAVPQSMLHMLMVRANHRFATVSEYAVAAGVDTQTVIDAFAAHLDAGLIRLEPVEGEVFVLTAPGGRPIPAHLGDVAPNLWELLRHRVDRHQAHRWWQVLRALELSGWEIEVGSPALTVSMSNRPGMPLPVAGVWVGTSCVPLIVDGDLELLGGPTGPLERYEQAGAPAVVVLAPLAGLDETITTVRRWALTRRVRPGLAILVLEAPRFDPVLISASDPAVPYKAVDRSTLAAWELT